MLFLSVHFEQDQVLAALARPINFQACTIVEDAVQTRGVPNNLLSNRLAHLPR